MKIYKLSFAEALQGKPDILRPDPITNLGGWFATTKGTNKPLPKPSSCKTQPARED